MNRPGLSAPALAQLATGSATLGILADCEFEGGFVYAWSGDYVLSYGGQSYLPTYGNISLKQISKTTADLRSEGLEVEFDIPSSELIALAVGYLRHGKSFVLRLAVIDAAGAVDAGIFFEGLMDHAEILDGPTNAKVTLFVEDLNSELGNSRDRRWTHEEQQIDYPGDLGFQFVPSVKPFREPLDKSNVKGPGIG